MTETEHPLLPPDIATACEEAWQWARQVPGGVTEREVKFLALALAAAPAEGAALEIGSFKGRSTVALGMIARRYGRGPVAAIDPHSGPSITDPPLGAEGSSYEAFLRNLREAGVDEQVEVHRAFSRDLAPGWNRPLRLLWIDGDHTYSGALEDWRLFGRHLAPGGIVALHDVLHSYEGPVRVFVEEILSSDDFGAAGVVGSIGWAQYRPGDRTARGARARRTLARRAARLIPFTRRAGPLRGIGKLRYKLHRWRVPHGGIDPRRWVELVEL